MNEFLSALVMNRSLKGIIPEKACAQVTVCIEATIPFRDKNDRGKSWPEILEQRLTKTNDHYGLSMSSVEIENAMKRAVLFANSDVANFAEQDVGRFLDNTWKLLLESNSVLYSGEIYYIKDYRRALQKMEGFFDALDPDTIFTQYCGVPSDTEFKRITQLARTNIYVAREYLGIKLLAIAILEALAELTGGDAPVALFMGDIRKEGENTKRLEDFLPVNMSDAEDHTSSIVTLLRAGRSSETRFDMKSSPTSFFLYKNLRQDRIVELLCNAKDMFTGKLNAREFLNRIERPIVSAIAKASAEMVVTRRKELLTYNSP